MSCGTLTDHLSRTDHAMPKKVADFPARSTKPADNIDDSFAADMFPSTNTKKKGKEPEIKVEINIPEVYFTKYHSLNKLQQLTAPIQVVTETPTGSSASRLLKSAAPNPTRMGKVKGSSECSRSLSPERPVEIDVSPLNVLEILGSTKPSPSAKHPLVSSHLESARTL